MQLSIIYLSEYFWHFTCLLEPKMETSVDKDFDSNVPALFFDGKTTTEHQRF